MGLHERQSNHGNFLSVKRGALCLESNEPLEGYEEESGEVDGRPYTKYFKRFQALDGIISKLELYDRTGGGTRFQGLKIGLKDNGQFFTIDLPLKSRHYDYFTKVMDNIDFSKPVLIDTWPDKRNAKNGHTPTAFRISQDGAPVQWAYTKDAPGECPQPTIDAMGKWDFRDQRNWLYLRLRDVIIPQVQEMYGFNEPEPEYDDEEVAETSKIQQIIAPKTKAKAAKASDLAPGEPPLYPNGNPDDSDVPF